MPEILEVMVTLHLQFFHHLPTPQSLNACQHGKNSPSIKQSCKLYPMAQKRWFVYSKHTQMSQNECGNELLIALL